MKTSRRSGESNPGPLPLHGTARRRISPVRNYTKASTAENKRAGVKNKASNHVDRGTKGNLVHSIYFDGRFLFKVWPNLPVTLTNVCSWENKECVSSRACFVGVGRIIISIRQCRWDPFHYGKQIQAGKEKKSRQALWKKFLTLRTMLWRMFRKH